jgi:hypothetical protein
MGLQGAFRCCRLQCDTGTFVPPACGIGEEEFTMAVRIEEKRVDEFQFHQLSVWAHLQNALLFLKKEVAWVANSG